MSNTWNGLVKIEEAQIVTKDGKIKWQQKNIHNILHDEGQKLILKCCFVNPYKNETDRILPPTNYYFGLDNRIELLPEDTISSLDGEPQRTTGYRRFAVKPTIFTLEKVVGVWAAKSPIVTFTATTDITVRNVFMMTTTQEKNELDEIVNVTYLISSVAFDEQQTITSGDNFRIKMSLSLQDIVP